MANWQINYSDDINYAKISEMPILFFIFIEKKLKT